MARNLITGDIHSEYGRLMAVLEKAGFNEQEDTLYSVGDFCDRGTEAMQTLRFLKGLKAFKPVIGNHDILLQKWFFTEIVEWSWELYMGGDRTLEDLARYELTREERIEYGQWLRRMPFVRVEERYIIAHGGIPHNRTMADLIRYQEFVRPPVFNQFGPDDAPAGTRDYYLSAAGSKAEAWKDPMFSFIPPFETDKTIFIGHTPTIDGRPFFSKDYHLVNLDTGAGSGGPLTLMDMDTFEFWQA